MKVRLQDKATLVILNCGFSWGNITDKNLTAQVEMDTGADHGSTRVRKTLLPKASGVHVKAVVSALSDFYTYHCAKTYATSVKGQRILPTAFFMEYEEKFADTQAKGDLALQVLKANYPASIEAAKPILGKAFNPDDYPPVDEIDRYYTLQRRFLPVPSGDAIMNALGAGVAAEVDVFVEELKAAAAADARQRMKEAVQRMAAVLTSKGAKIYDTMPEAINTLAKELPVIAGLADDKGLADLVAQVKESLGGYSADDFRKNESARKQVGKQALDILKKFQ